MNFEIIPPIIEQETFAERGEIRVLNRLKKAYGGKNWRPIWRRAHLSLQKSHRSSRHLAAAWQTTHQAPSEWRQ